MTRLQVPILLVALVAGVILCAGGCGKEPVGTQAQSGILVLTISFEEQMAGQMPRLSPSKLGIDSLSIEVGGSGMDTIERIFPVEGGVAEGTIESIPAGPDRMISALAWSGNPRVDLYEGSDTVTIEAGGIAEATLIMSRIRNDIVAHLLVEPESTFVNTAVFANASGSYDYYLPDSLLTYRFLLDGIVERTWGPDPVDTLSPTTKGVHTVTVEVRNTEGTSDQAAAMLAVLNRPPGAPTGPSPEPGDTVATLTPILAWSADDPDGDDLYYIVWLGDDSTAVRLEQEPAQMFESEVESLQTETLPPESTFYWKVIAQDDETSAESSLWSFVIPPAPLAVEPDSVLLPCGIDEGVVTLHNLTSGAVDWSATWSAEWLEVVPSFGTLARTPKTVSMSVTTRSGYDPGFEHDLVTFVSGGFTVDVFVQLEITPLLAEPLPDEVILAEPGFEDSVVMTNGGCGDVVWAVTAIQGDWLSVFPTAGVVEGNAETVVAMTADTTGLYPGSYSGSVDFSVVDTLYSLSVLLEIPEVATLTVVPDSLHLGPEVYAAACSLYNRGNAPVEWHAQWLANWLTLTPESGTLAPNHGTEIGVVADTASLPTGETDVVVVFTGGDTPATLHIGVEVVGEPVLHLAPRQVTFPADTDSSGFQIRNVGTGNLSWYVSAHPGWCQTFPSSGIVPEGEERAVSLSVDRESMTPGSYPAGLSINSNGGSDVLQMTLEVGATGCSDPVYYEDFNTGNAAGWQPHSGAGSWTVQDGRYLVSGILPDTLAWAIHEATVSNPAKAQVDTRFPAPPIDSGIVAVFVEIAPGYSLWIDGKNCDALGAGLQWNGYTFGVARELVNGEWFAFGVIQEADLFFPTWWNTLAIAIDNSYYYALVNGIVEVSVPHVGGAIPVVNVGILASELDSARFDRVYVCPPGG